MKINSINITGFRNFDKLEVEFSPGVNIFYGDNGSGKTNLLEAIFVLCLGRSHRSANETVMVNQNSDHYRLEALISHEEKKTEAAVAYQRGGRKKVTIDKVAVKTSELYDNFCAVSVGPEDSEIISGSPSARRSFIDIYLSQYSPNYLHSLVNYQKILVQKNAALKNQFDPSPYNELMIETGSYIMSRRVEFIELIKNSSVKSYSSVSGGDQLGVSYRPSVKIESEDIESIKESYRQTLADYLQKEEIMSSSLVGPHRDDIYFSIGEFPARSHGSQGEWRTAALSLKIAVHTLIAEKRNITPILLLDEIFAELDHKRSEALMNTLSDYKQLFLTTAVEPPEFLKNNSRSFKIDNGSIIYID